MTLSCIIVEDQRPAQKILERYIGDTPELELRQTFVNPLEAISYLKSTSVDLVFLDIHLPKLSGIDFMRVLPNPPMVIFTTAFQEYALTGFELSAVDYLLKPFDFRRFYQAVNKALDRVNKDAAVHQSKPSQEEKSPANYYFAKIDRELIKIRFDEITFIKASGDFVHIYFKDKKLFLSENLKFWENLLPEHLFMKVHKSYIIRLDQIDKVSGNIIHVNKESIPIGRSFRQAFLERLNQ